MLSLLGGADLFISALGMLGPPAQGAVAVFVRATPVHVKVAAGAELDAADVVAGTAVHRRGVRAEGLTQLLALSVPDRFLLVPGAHCGQDLWRFGLVEVAHDFLHAWRRPPWPDAAWWLSDGL
ncbi:hypothetical protein D3C81_1994440 [compost metagenome]